MSAVVPPRFSINSQLAHARRVSQPPAAPAILADLASRFPLAKDVFQDTSIDWLRNSHDPFFVTFRTQKKAVWQQVQISIFPYQDAGWLELVNPLFDFEGRSWTLWCDWAYQQRDGDRLPIAPNWYGLPALMSGRHPLFGGHVVDGIAVLVRPFLPWPTLHDRPLPPAKQQKALADLTRIAQQELGIPNATTAPVAPYALASDGRYIVPFWWSMLRTNLDEASRTLLRGEP